MAEKRARIPKGEKGAGQYISKKAEIEQKKTNALLSKMSGLTEKQLAQQKEDKAALDAQKKIFNDIK